MKDINMNTIKSLIEDELHELSTPDRNTIFCSIKWLVTDLEIDEEWINNAKKQEKSLERYIFDGVVDFMKEKNINADKLYFYEDETKIFDCIHGF